MPSRMAGARGGEGPVAISSSGFIQAPLTSGSGRLLLLPLRQGYAGAMRPSAAAILELARRMGVLSEATLEDLSREAALQQSAGQVTPEVLDAQPAAAKPGALEGPRFAELGELGQGSSGRVVKALDRKLKRQVALKLLMHDDPRSVARFLREASAQARVEHPHVCRVFDVTEHGGRACIAMELVEGGTLSTAAAEMTLEQRVRALAEVAEAVQAAHEQGLLHRDLKPGNVLVQRTAGGFRPVVADFGLAQELDASATATGRLAGTPQFMAPEQAQGEAVLDRRADVWALGATAYAVLVGRPPFEGTIARVIWQVLHDEPPAPRKLAPRLPRDLETVLLKCLRKDPGERYASARELADELRRWLRGEPVQARRPGLILRAASLARRRPRLSAGLMIASALLAGGALWLRARVAGLTEAARVHGRALERAELGLRLAYALPLHDVTPEREQLRAVMREVAQGMEGLPAAGRASSHAVLGRAHLALGELDEARRELSQSVALGPAPAAVSADLGIALGRLYQRARGEAERLREPAAKEAALQKAGLELRDPALRHLRSARAGGAPSPLYLEALAAEVEGRDEDAARLGAQAATEEPQLAEAWRLVGEARNRQALAHLEARRHAELQALLQQSGAAFARALDLARSDPDLLDGECRRLQQQTADFLWHGTVAEGEATAGAAIAACERVLVVDPLHKDAPYRLGHMLLHRLVRMSNAEEKTRDLKMRTLQAAELAIARRPEDSDGWELRANALRVIGYDPNDIPTALIACAWSQQDATRGAELADTRRLPYLLQVRAMATFQEAQLRELRGEDARPVFGRAIADLERVIALRPSPAASSLLGYFLRRQARAAAAAGGDFRRDLNAGEAHELGALAQEPKDSDILLQTTFTMAERAELEAGAGGDGARWAARGLELFDRLAATGVKGPFLKQLRCRLLSVEVETAVRAGRRATEMMAKAGDCFAEKSIDGFEGAALRLLLARAVAVPSRGAEDLRAAREVRKLLSPFEARRIAPLVKRLELLSSAERKR